ncbi:hypothetical protein [Ralstonia psammae]|nr:hypothetical protein [Ralstonia sp. LMG 19083]
MERQDLDAIRRAAHGELRTAILGVLPENAVLRLEDDCLSELYVHAWWRVSTIDGQEAVNSLSFHLSSAMLATYLGLPQAERADRCSRLKAWAAWALDGAPRVNDGEEGFDISVVVPLNVFWPDRTSAI